MRYLTPFIEQEETEVFESEEMMSPSVLRSLLFNSFWF